MIEFDQRVFLRTGLRIAREAHERVWDEAAAEPGDPDGPELHEVVYERIGGLWPSEYEWMHEAGVLRDAVTNFEVYLEQVRAEVPSRLAKPSGKDPHWGDLRDFFAKLGIAIETDEVTRVRELRHLLTHQRGALRTEARRAKFAGAVSSYSLEAPIVDLSEDVVVQAMDALAAAVRRIDALVWQLRS
jgi:hypothetical protein